MKTKHLFALAALMMLALMITSCTTNDQAGVPEAAKCVVGLEKYQTKIDYSFFYNNIRQNVADRIAAWLLQTNN